MSNTYTYTQLEKKSKQDTSSLPRFRLAILGDCATQHLAIALKGYAYTQGLALDVFDAEYNQILPLTIDGCSDLYNFNPNAILLVTCVEMLYDSWLNTPYNLRTTFYDKEYIRINEYWTNILSHRNVSIIQLTYTEYDDGIFGNYACKQPHSFIFQLRKLNMQLMEECAKNNNVFIVDLCGLQAQLGRNYISSTKLYYTCRLPYSLNALPTITAKIINAIQSLRGVVVKCVILDLDNTLWGGIIGDDGLPNIQIGDLGIGQVYTAIQTWLKELKNRGIILAVCSKNDESIAKEPFIKHNDMVLRLDDFAIFVANWEDKATNINYIKQKLNIGMDSIVFIDDNPFERDLVRTLIPEIIVPDLPDDPVEYIPYLQTLNLFEISYYSSNDIKRTEQYRAEAQRETIRMQYSDINEYLKNLNMIATTSAFDDISIPRIAQLTQRSNQFNLRTIRYSISEIEAVSTNSDYIGLYFTLSDKISNHGLISVVIMKKHDSLSLFIDTWLMSCRVLKRGMEEFVVNKMIDTCKSHGFDNIIGEYIKTDKNVMVADIYEKLGFTRTANNFFVANVNDFKYNNTYIEEH